MAAPCDPHRRRLSFAITGGIAALALLIAVLVAAQTLLVVAIVWGHAAVGAVAVGITLLAAFGLLRTWRTHAARGTPDVPRPRLR